MRIFTLPMNYFKGFDFLAILPFGFLAYWLLIAVHPIVYITPHALNLVISPWKPTENCKGSPINFTFFLAFSGIYLLVFHRVDLLIS